MQMLSEKIASRTAGEKQQFVAWAGDVPFLATRYPAGAGYFDRISFALADDGFNNPLANHPCEMFADPADIDASPSPSEWLSCILTASIKAF